MKFTPNKLQLQRDHEAHEVAYYGDPMNKFVPPVETVKVFCPSLSGTRGLRHMSMRICHALHIRRRKTWLGREDDPVLKILLEAYRLGREERDDGMARDQYPGTAAGDSCGTVDPAPDAGEDSPAGGAGRGAGPQPGTEPFLSS